VSLDDHQVLSISKLTRRYRESVLTCSSRREVLRIKQHTFREQLLIAMDNVWPWLALLGLGAYHGINPGMGWLFAVALGMQEKRQRAVLAAIPPIALGHALSIGLVVAILWLAQASIPQQLLRYGAAAILFGFGLFRLFRSRHPRWVGMRVGFRDLTTWSFLMATAHGAGLMVVPILIGWHGGNSTTHLGPVDAMGHADHMQMMTHTGDPSTTLEGALRFVAAVVVHTGGYLLVATLIALVVYKKFGLALLQRAWFNLDLLWVIALMLSGLVIVFKSA
jgi:hypothetical protein